MNRLGGASGSLRPFWSACAPKCALFAACATANSASAASAPDPSSTLSLAFIAAVVLLVLVATLTVHASRQRRALAEALRAARADTYAIEQLLDVWLWSSDAEHRVLKLRPPRHAPASGWAAATTSRCLWDCFVPADIAALRARLDNNAPLDEVEVRIGETTAGLLSGRAIVDEAGRFAGYRGVLRERVEPEKTLPSSTPAQPTGQLAPKIAPAVGAAEESDSFGFTVSHDLRAPIRVVEGFTKIVKEDYGRLLDRVGNDHLDRVLGAAARMQNMIDALLALSKLSSQPLARQPVNLSQLATFVADDLRRNAPGRDVRIEIDPGMQVQGDPTLLRVAIENLLGNAWKYSSKTTPAVIAFGRHATDAHTFSISDNGAGFDMRFADRLFGVFQRLHSANDFPGTGVGLASVRRIVRRHGGEIWGEGEPGHGARFHFSLPRD